MGFVETPVLEIELEDEGPAEGRPVLLLHGWPDAPCGWRPVASRLQESGWRTIVPALRGSGATHFRSPDAPRDERGVALAADAVELIDALGLERVPVVGHDWGARVAYTLAAVAPERVTAIVALALPYQPRGVFTIPAFEQARAFWYQWLMYVDAGAQAVASDPVGCARVQWETWSPPGWFDDDEFDATARSFMNPDWVAITLNAYCSRFLAGEVRDPRYDPLARRLADVEQIATPTLMIQGADDRCDEPAGSADQERFFTGRIPPCRARPRRSFPTPRGTRRGRAEHRPTPLGGCTLKLARSAATRQPDGAAHRGPAGRRGRSRCPTSAHETGEAVGQ